MKNIFFTFIFFLITYQTSAQWIPQNSGTDGHLNSIYFVNQLDGWICGSGGLLLKTDDGGSNWKRVSLNFNNDFGAIYFIDENIGWLVGSNGIILKTIDGGKQWNEQNSNTLYGLTDVFFVDENNGWITTGTIDSTLVLKTTNGGQSWVSYPNGIITNSAVYFTDVNHGWVGGWGANLSRTTDGGISWSLQPSGTTISRSDIFFVNKNVGWTFGGTITKTTDGGNSWFTLPSFNRDMWVNSGFFLNENIGWVCGGESNTYGNIGKIFKTTDGGMSWKEEFSQYDIPLYKIFFVDNVNGWVSGMNGFIAKHDTTKSVQLVSPNGGEQWLAGSFQVIQWQKNNIEFVKLLYSTNNAQSWLSIADSIDALGYYWNPIPNTSSNYCIVKIVDVDNPGIYDLSDSSFSIIYDPQITVITPDGNDSIWGGSTFTINWTSQQVNSVNILLSLNSGLNWQTIASNLSYIGNTGQFDWNVPDTSSELCLIKVESSSDTLVFDTSDNSFRIINTPPNLKSFFPLQVGNYWLYKVTQYFLFDTSYGYTYSEVLKDTTIATKTYNKVKIAFDWDQTFRDSIKYLRYDSLSSSIIEYSKFQGGEGTIFKLNASENESWNYFGSEVCSGKIETLSLFGTTKPCKPFGDCDYSPPFWTYVLAEDIGPIILGDDQSWGFTMYTDYDVVYAKINGVEYGNFVSVSDRNSELPAKFYLSQNYPNPFNPTTNIGFRIAKFGFVSLKVYDILGREVATLVNEEKHAGNYEVKFSAKGGSASGGDAYNLSSGIYFYKLSTENYTSVKKMILMK